MNIDEQIKWVESSIRNMRKNFPEQVASGRMTQERASYLAAAAQATLETLTQLRGLARRGVNPQTRTGEAA